MAKKCFLWIEALLYLGFLYLDIGGGDWPIEVGCLSSLLKYSGVVLCFFWSCRYRQWITFGLFGTVCADFFLLFTEQWLTGVICFLAVQLCYSIWLGTREQFGSARHLRRLVLLCAGRAAGAAAVLLFGLALAGVSIDLLLLVTVMYAMLLVQNTIKGVRSGERLFAVGMCLFLLCDLQVGIYNIAAYLPQLEGSQVFSWLEQVASVGMWACYLPAKVLIALSGEKHA